MTKINTHNLVCDFGKHSGTLYTRIPVSYLRWMINANHPKAEIAAAELDRRGTVIPDMDVSGHAIDSASLRFRKTWHLTSRPDEGLHAWLLRVAAEAVDKGMTDEEGRYHYLGIKFVFAMDGVWPVLQTVTHSKISQLEIA